MNTFSIYKKAVVKAAAMLVALAPLASCTETWDDHYAVQTNGEGTIWELLNSKPELSNFRDVIEATDYLSTLNSSQVFTVFAPTNDNFTAERRDEIIKEFNEEKALNHKLTKNSAIKEFIMNHIALYNYSTHKEFKDTTITMLNGKVVPFTQSTFAGKNLLESNILTRNGVLYTIDGEAKYDFNIFEKIKKIPELDSVAKFLYMNKPYQMYVELFNPELSVPGDMVDGQQHYLDSVVETHNKILEELTNAYLDNEDSTYIALFPTNKEWKALLERNEQMFKYARNTDKRDSLEYVTPRYLIVEGIFFPHSWNKDMFTQNIDSIKSTLAKSYNYRKLKYGSFDEIHYEYKNPYDAGGIFDGTKTVECSNGQIKISDDWKIKRRQTFLANRIYEAESRYTLDTLSGVNDAAKPDWIDIEVKQDNEYYNKISNHTFKKLITRTSDTTPYALLKLSDLFSNTKYDLHVIMAPVGAMPEELRGKNDSLTTLLIPTLYFKDMESGKQVEYPITSKDSPDIVSKKFGLKKIECVEVAYDELRDVNLGTYSFPTCSYGLEVPEVYLKLQAWGQTDIYTSGFRIDRIELRPHDE